MADSKLAQDKPTTKTSPKGFRKHVRRLQIALKAIHNFGESFEKHSRFVHDLNDQYLTPALQLLNIPQNSNIFDYGSRNGVFTVDKLVPLAEEKNLKIFAIEECEALHQDAVANHQHDRITYINEDILSENFSLKDKKFPAGISLYYLQNRKNYRAVLDKLYNILEDGGKLCLFVTTMVDDYFQFVKMLQDSTEWKALGDQLAIPDWILARWAGRDHIEILKNAVTSAGFEIKKFQLVDNYTIFQTKKGCAEFILAATMADIAEGLPTPEAYEKLESEYTQFLDERVTETCGRACGAGPRRHRSNYQVAIFDLQK